MEHGMEWDMEIWNRHTEQGTEIHYVPIILPQSQPLVKDCEFGVSPVNYSDSDSDTTHGNSWNVRVMFFFLEQTFKYWTSKKLLTHPK